MKKIPIRLREDNQGRYLGLFLFSVAVFAISAWAASAGRLLPWEKSVLFAIYNLPGWLRPLGVLVTQFGSATVVVVVSLILLTGQEKSRHRGRLILANCVITYGLVNLAKLIVGRPRPIELVQHLQQRDLVVNGLGFPSGHTALATVLSLVLVSYLRPGWRWLPVVWIVLVGLSRIYLGVHAPLDIIGGFSLGLAVISTQRLLRVR